MIDGQDVEVVETVAQAIWNAGPTPYGWGACPVETQAYYRDLAAAAIAAMPASPAEAAVTRVEALAKSWEDRMRAMGYADGHHDGATAIRAALAAPLAGQPTTDEEAHRG